LLSFLVVGETQYTKGELALGRGDHNTMVVGYSYYYGRFGYECICLPYDEDLLFALLTYLLTE